MKIQKHEVKSIQVSQRTSTAAFGKPAKGPSGITLCFTKSIKNLTFIWWRFFPMNDGEFINYYLSDIFISNLSPYPEGVIEAFRKKKKLHKSFRNVLEKIALETLSNIPSLRILGKSLINSTLTTIQPSTPPWFFLPYHQCDSL